MKDKCYTEGTSKKCEGCMHLKEKEIITDGIVLWINLYCQKQCKIEFEHYEAGEVLRTDGRRGMW